MHPICAADMLDNILLGTKTFGATGTASDVAASAPTLTFNSEGFIPILYCEDVADDTTAVTITVDRAVWIIDTWAIKTGGTGGGTCNVVVATGSTPDTVATLSLNSAANGAVARATSILPRYIDTSTTITLTPGGTTDRQALVFVLCLRVGNIS